MKRPTTLYTCATGVLFVLLYAVGRIPHPPLQTLLYGAAYALPIACALWVGKAVEAPILESPARPRGIRHAVLCFPAVFGLLLCVALVSAAAFSSPVTEAPSRVSFFSVARYALLCPLAEECFFRLLPLRLYPKQAVKEAFLVSLLAFALFHATAARLPHAALAAAVFFLADLAADSVWPSLILHTLNNALALVYACFSQHELFRTVFYISVAVTAVLSLIYAFLQRKRFIYVLKNHFSPTT